MCTFNIHYLLAHFVCSLQSSLQRSAKQKALIIIPAQRYNQDDLQKRSNIFPYPRYK